MSLNPNQARAVAATLLLLEERLADTQRIASENEDGILYRRISHFTPTERDEMDNIILAMHEQIGRAADEFHLSPQERNAASHIIGTLSLTWESLEEVRPRKLQSYGEVDPALHESLEPILQQLIRLLFRLIDVASGTMRTKQSDSYQEE
jgi:hypothetical protein